MVSRGWHKAAIGKQRVNCRAWTRQGLCPSRAWATSSCWKSSGKHGPQGWGELAPGPHSAQEEELDEEMLRQ